MLGAHRSALLDHGMRPEHHAHMLEELRKASWQEWSSFVNIRDTWRLAVKMILSLGSTASITGGTATRSRC